jgi:hypothetical protein
MRLKNKNLSYLLALALSAGGAVASADSLNGTGSWQASWSTATLAVDGSSVSVGTPYWNNASGDGPKANVGWCLTGGGACSMPAGTPGVLSYYGNGGASANSMYFTSTGTPLNISLQTLLTTQKSTASGYDLFGYYLAGGSGQAPSSPDLNPLFDSRTDVPGNNLTLSSLTAGENYGFYIENVQGAGTANQTNYFYFMDSASNTATGSMPADGLQHFAAFDGGSGTYFLGDVDADACQNGFLVGNSPCVPGSQFDYNNMVVEITPNAGGNTPEPASFALMSGGLVVLAAVIRRKKGRQFEN